jgi:hypothetical protein
MVGLFFTIQQGAIMQSHYEVYRGWSVSVQISAHLSRIDTDRKTGAYMPRIVITHHDGASFKDREIAEGHTYSTPEECIQRGVIHAREYIDSKEKAVGNAANTEHA